MSNPSSPPQPTPEIRSWLLDLREEVYTNIEHTQWKSIGKNIFEFIKEEFLIQVERVAPENYAFRAFPIDQPDLAKTHEIRTADEYQTIIKAIWHCAKKISNGESVNLVTWVLK